MFNSTQIETLTKLADAFNGKEDLLIDVVEGLALDQRIQEVNASTSAQIVVLQNRIAEIETERQQLINQIKNSI